MTERNVTHATFVIERTYPVPPARVFAAFADPTIKSRWFRGPNEWGVSAYELDFRVGGREINRGGPEGGPIHSYEARYLDIVQDERIIHSYDMHMDATRISVSLATTEFKPEGTGTRLIFTEQGAFLDVYDDPTGREFGSRMILDRLGTVLEEVYVDV